MKHITIERIAFFLVLSYFLATTVSAQNSQNCTLIGCAGIGRSSGVCVVGNLACFGDDLRYLKILDISGPANPTVLASIVVPSRVEDVIINGLYAYVAVGDSGLLIFDISNPEDPKEVCSFNTDGPTLGIVINGSYAYVANGRIGLCIMDISDPVNPTEIGLFDAYGGVCDVAVNGSYAYVAAGSDGLRVIDITNPAVPKETDYVTTGSSALSLVVSDSYVYVVDLRNGLCIINISNPSDLKATGLLDTGDMAQDVAVSGSYAYVADILNGLLIIDISDPAKPIEVGFYKDGIYTPESVAVSGSYIYLVDYSFGLHIIQNDLMTGVKDNSIPVAEPYLLYQNYPNPINSSTRIMYKVSENALVEISIYNVRGEHIDTPVSHMHSAGSYTYTWNGMDSYGQQLSSGVYLYRVTVKTENRTFTQIKKIVLTK